MVTVDVPKEQDLVSPVKGQVIPLSEAKDEAFASEGLGKGFVVLPEEGVVKAPFDATVTALFPTNHAICLTGTNGVEMMIHIGIDTVKLEGKCLQALVHQDDEVKTGDVLVKFDIDGIKEAGYSEQTMIIITNTDEFAAVTADVNRATDGSEPILHLSK